MYEFLENICDLGALHDFARAFAKHIFSPDNEKDFLNMGITSQNNILDSVL